MKKDWEIKKQNLEGSTPSTCEAGVSPLQTSSLPQHALKAGWQIKTLQEVCCMKITDGTHQTPKYCEENEGGFPFISAKNVTKGVIDWTDIKYIIPELHEELYKRIAPKRDDILLAKNGTTGVAALVDVDKVFDIYVTLAVLRPDKNIIFPRYLLYVVNSQYCKAQFDSHLKGIGVPNLHLVEIQQVKIPLPPLEEQKRIVDVLDEKFAQLETIKANAQSNLQNAKDLFQSQLTKAFSNTTWEKKKISEISENLDSKRIPITKNVRKAGQYPYYGASGIVDYVEDYIFDGKFLLVSEDGANLLARTYPIAFIAEGKFWVNNHAHILSFKDEITMKFVELYFSNLDISPYVTGMAQPKFNQASLNNIEIPLPPLPEQKRIVKELDTLSEKVRQLQDIYTKQISDCDELKQSLLAKAFEGEL